MRGKLRVRLLLLVWAVVAGSVYFCGLILGATVTGGALLAAALFAGAAAGVLISEVSVRWFDETVRPLTDAARRMQEGDLSVRTRVGRGEDVGQLPVEPAGPY